MTENQSEPTTHLRVLVQALQVANKRGTFELDESGKIQDSVKFFSSENETRTDEQQKGHLQCLVGMCEVAQKRGAFNLAESHTVYPHVKFFLQDTPVEEASEVQVDESANKEHCADECPCPPENCPCDAENNCKEGDDKSCCKDECPCPPENCPCDAENNCKEGDDKSCCKDECPCPPENCPCDENESCERQVETKELQKPNIEQTIEKVLESTDKENNWNDY